jgi:hypothetical protein
MYVWRRMYSTDKRKTKAAEEKETRLREINASYIAPGPKT